jgi:hypothetical protein
MVCRFSDEILECAYLNIIFVSDEVGLSFLSFFRKLRKVGKILQILLILSNN